MKGEGIYALALLVHLVGEHNGIVGPAREVSPWAVHSARDRLGPALTPAPALP